MNHFFVTYKAIPFICAFTASILLISCRKHDTEDPVVRILSPVGSPSYAWGNLIPVEIEVSDNEEIQQITVGVTDYQGRPVLSGKVINLNGQAHYKTSVVLTVDNPELSAGAYILRVKAFDGNQTGEDILGIDLQSAPYYLNRIYVVRKADAFHTAIDSIVGSSGLMSGRTLSGQFFQGTAFSRTQHILLCDIRAPEIVALSSPLLNTENEQSFPWGFGTDYFTDIEYDVANRETWVSSADGFIRELDGSGSVNTTITAFHPKQILPVGNYVYSFGEDSQLNRRLDVYLKSSGQLIQSLLLHSALSDIQPLDHPDRVLLIKDNSPTYPLLPYERIGNYIDEWTSFRQAESSPVIGSCSSPDGVIIAHESRIVFYSFSGQLVKSSAAPFHPVAMECQADQSGVLWVLENGLVSRLNYRQTGMPSTQSITTGGGDKDLLLMYNR